MLDAEVGILGGLVLNPKSYWDIASLEAGDFSKQRHRHYFEVIKEMLIAGDSVDLITVSERLGGASLADLGSYANSTPGTANIKHYARLVRESAMRRHAQTVLHSAIGKLAAKADINEVIGEVLTTLERHQGASDKPFSKVLSEALIAADQAQQLKWRDVIGADTTLPKLNRLTKGFHGGKLITIGGRPGTFKSAFALQIAVKNALKGVPVGFLSYEMLSSEIGQRALAQIHGVDGQLLAAGDARTIEQIREKETGASAKATMWVDDKSQTLAEMISRIIEWKNRHDMQIVFVDYLQLVSVRGRSKREEIGDITRQLKLLAMRLEMPIVILSQLNRESEKMHRRPQLSDLRESGDIEQDSDIVIFTHCEKALDELERDSYELILAKQRGGPARLTIPLVINEKTYSLHERISIKGY